jgi:hypothetical protein
MRRLGLSVLCLIAIGAGCSSRATFFATDGGGNDGGSVVSSGSDGGSTKRKDSSVEEEEPDATAVKKDASTPPPVDGCEPGSVSSFTPTWKAPATPHSSQCTATQVDTLLCLFDASANQTTCQTAVDDPANDTCFKCIYTASTAAKLGPVVITGSLGSLNIAGCIAAQLQHQTACRI